MPVAGQLERRGQADRLIGQPPTRASGRAGGQERQEQQPCHVHHGQRPLLVVGEQQAAGRWVVQVAGRRRGWSAWRRGLGGRPGWPPPPARAGRWLRSARLGLRYVARSWNKTAGQATVFAEITDATLQALPGILNPGQDGYDDTNEHGPADQELVGICSTSL